MPPVRPRPPGVLPLPNPQCMAPPKPAPPESFEYVKGGWPAAAGRGAERVESRWSVLVGGLVALGGVVVGFALGRML